MDLNRFKKTVDDSSVPDGFIKVTDKPVQSLNSEQKVMLNRKGNVLFNEGRIEEAARIFITTGYSDGLTRVGDVFMNKNKSLQALKFYLLAHNTKKAEPIFEKISGVLSILIKE